jgi:protein SCO1/2
MRVRYFVLVGIGLFLVVAGLLVSQSLARSYTFQGSLIDPPLQAEEIVLVDQHGQVFRLSEQRGHVVLLYFGYTYCPDVCPATLAQYRQIKIALGDKAEQVRFVFITVDPERDTPEQIRSYLERFDASFIGLSGPKADLERVWKDYGIYVRKNETESSTGYLVDHSARIYLVDPQGNLRLTYSFGTDSQPIVQDVLHLLRE